MDGDDVSTSELQRLAAVVAAKAMLVKDASGNLKYDVTPGKRTGGRKRLAEDAGMDIGQLTRLLKGERMPDVRPFVRLAKALGTTAEKLLAESESNPPQSAPQEAQESVRSRPLTPDEAADSWQVDVADVRAMLEILRKKPKADAADDREGREEAHG